MELFLVPNNVFCNFQLLAILCILKDSKVRCVFKVRIAVYVFFYGLYDEV